MPALARGDWKYGSTVIPAPREKRDAGAQGGNN